MTSLSESQIWIELESCKNQHISKEVLGDNSSSLYLTLLILSSISTITLLPPKLQRRGLVFKGKMVTMERVLWVTVERVCSVTVEREEWVTLVYGSYEHVPISYWVVPFFGGDWLL